MQILHNSTDETKEFYTEERCHILELQNLSDDRTQSIARARIEVGVTTAWHRLKETVESFYILSGTGVIEIGEEKSFKIKSGDCIRIPPHTAQRIHNDGTEDLMFLCFCTPAFSDESYESLE